MGSYRPNYAEDDSSNQPVKRRRVDGREPSSRGRHPYRRKSTLPGRQTSNTSAHQRLQSEYPSQAQTSQNNVQSKNKKSLKERKNNRSSRIHSIRKLLARGGLPADIHREKERELAALLFDQQKDMIKKDSRKTLQRYHYVRFVERQKATRTVRRLKKQQELGDESERLKNQIHEAEVDLNYTMYAPLAQKYIGIYATQDSSDGKGRPSSRNPSKMNRADFAILSDEQKRELEEATAEAANILTLAENNVKPPIWYVVEAKMKEGQKALETLRGEQPAVNIGPDLVESLGVKRNANWLNGNGAIDVKDLDSDADGEDGGVSPDARENEDMSDGDGGFFERR